VLHVGLGTFRPVKTENIEDHIMHEEYYSVPAVAAAKINSARKSGGRIIAVGTTSVRTLESVSDEKGEISAGSGSTGGAGGAAGFAASGAGAGGASSGAATGLSTSTLGGAGVGEGFSTSDASFTGAAGSQTSGTHVAGWQVAGMQVAGRQVLGTHVVGRHVLGMHVTGWQVSGTQTEPLDAQSRPHAWSMNLDAQTDPAGTRPRPATIAHITMTRRI
ncbi:MAG: S-adenosylmethionine:tRNA ribosyltransferase-isomerase, partial [Planctomycetia bacterium]|nr:S-adenosylmethionine:tRNA ribosyltransferase-isomerase [Planctomycetia bacterium]